MIKLGLIRNFKVNFFYHSEKIMSFDTQQMHRFGYYKANKCIVVQQYESVLRCYNRLYCLTTDKKFSKWSISHFTITSMKTPSCERSLPF